MRRTLPFFLVTSRWLSVVTSTNSPGPGSQKSGRKRRGRPPVGVPAQDELDRLVLPRDAVEVEDAGEALLGVVGEADADWPGRWPAGAGSRAHRPGGPAGGQVAAAGWPLVGAPRRTAAGPLSSTMAASSSDDDARQRERR